MSAARTLLSPRSPIRPSQVRRGVLALGLAAAAGGTALAMPADAQGDVVPAPTLIEISPTISAQFAFTTLDDSTDLTFNQLLGINDLGKIAGYYRSGASAAHPNKGYTISAYSAMTFDPENYPDSVQTQVTGLNDMGKTVGFYVDKAGDNFGFWSKYGPYASFSAPGAAGKTKTTQLLGVNNEGLAVGFYNDAAGNSHAFTYNTKTGAYRVVTVPGAVSSRATGIDDNGDVSGTFTNAKKVTDGFLVHGGLLETIAVPRASATDVFGLKDADEVVGQYTVGKATHGFVEKNGKYNLVDDPSGIGTTTINGVNNLGDIVGFYTDSRGNTVGFVGQPQ